MHGGMDEAAVRDAMDAFMKGARGPRFQEMLAACRASESSGAWALEAVQSGPPGARFLDDVRKRPIPEYIHPLGRFVR